MKLLVIGSTGRTGRHVLTQAIQRGHQVTAFSRRPQDLEVVEGLAKVIQGDGDNLDDIRAAVQGQDAIISAIGTSRIARNLIIAMRESGVRRVVMTSSRSVPATEPKLVIALAWLIFRPHYADLARAEGMFEFSGVDWTIARGTMLDDGPFTGKVHVDFEANATGGDYRLSRADYAMVMLDAIEDPSLIGKAMGIGGAKAGKDAPAGTQQPAR